MHAFILTGGTQASRAKYLSGKISSQTELIHVTTDKSSLTIKQVQDLSRPLSISPRLPRIVWIEEANLLTVPAQNALLKMLEEPPADTSFYLTCNSKTSLLPTVLSRSKVISLNPPPLIEDSGLLTELKTIMSLSPGDRLAGIIKRDRTQSIAWLTQIELSLRDKLHGKSLAPGNYHTLAKISRLALTAHAELSANCSVGLATQNFLLSLPKTK